MRPSGRDGSVRFFDSHVAPAGASRIEVFFAVDIARLR